MLVKEIYLFLVFLICFTSSFKIQSPFRSIESIRKEDKIKIGKFTAIISTILCLNGSPLLADDWSRLADVGVKEFLVKDGRQFLRLAQPVVLPNKEIALGAKRTSDETKIQESLELIRLRLEQVGVTNPTAWGALGVDESLAETLFKKQQNEFISSAVDSSIATRLIEEKLKPDFLELQDAVKTKNGLKTLDIAEKTAADFSRLRSLKVPQRDQLLPYTIPEEYSSLPRLEGYATVDMKVLSKKGFKIPDSFKTVPEVTFTLTVDGYHAPLTAGNFIDLVDKKLYDGMSIQKAEELFVQTGKPSTGDGYIDPTSRTLRTIPLEIFYKQDSEPVYGATSDEDNRATETMALPFQAYGAIGMARDNSENDSGSSQFFFLKWKQALNPPGRNTLDGFYSCFGYITSTNELFLDQVTTDDKIVSMKVIDGLQNLRRPSEQK
jgi:peptidylprolyl isomerase